MREKNCGFSWSVYNHQKSDTHLAFCSHNIFDSQAILEVPLSVFSVSLVPRLPFLLSVIMTNLLFCTLRFLNWLWLTNYFAHFVFSIHVDEEENVLHHVVRLSVTPAGQLFGPTYFVYVYLNRYTFSILSFGWHGFKSQKAWCKVCPWVRSKVDSENSENFLIRKKGWRMRDAKVCTQHSIPTQNHVPHQSATSLEW